MTDDRQQQIPGPAGVLDAEPALTAAEGTTRSLPTGATTQQTTSWNVPAWLVGAAVAFVVLVAAAVGPWSGPLWHHDHTNTTRSPAVAWNPAEPAPYGGGADLGGSELGGTTLGSSGLGSSGWGATARCGDGTLSFSQNHRGTCSWHGGVSTWLDGTNPDTSFWTSSGWTCVGASITACTSWSPDGVLRATCYQTLGSCTIYYPDGRTETVR